MSDFKAKMHQIRFRLGLAPDPAGEAYSAPPDSLARFKGAYFEGEGGEEKGRGEEGEGRSKEKGKGRDGKGRESVPLVLILQFDHCRHADLFIYLGLDAAAHKLLMMKFSGE